MAFPMQNSKIFHNPRTKQSRGIRHRVAASIPTTLHPPAFASCVCGLFFKIPWPLFSSRNSLVSGLLCESLVWTDFCNWWETWVKFQSSACVHPISREPFTKTSCPLSDAWRLHQKAVPGDWPMRCGSVTGHSMMITQWWITLIMYSLHEPWSLRDSQL